MMDCERLAQVITARTGVELTRGGLRDSLELYYKRRLEDLGLVRLDDYIALIKAPGGQELERLIEIISVPHTWFFRDKEQLKLVGDLMTKLARTEKVLNVWIPGCASGEDAYSVALIAASRGINTRITGSDLCAHSLSIARRGIYSPFSLRALPHEYRGHFRAVGRNFEITPALGRQISFHCHNLLDPALTTPGGWHLILCRNVFIYFSKETAGSCATRLGRQLHESGYALFGAGELIGTTPGGLEAHTENNRVLFRKPTRSALNAEREAKHPAPISIPETKRISSVVPLPRLSTDQRVTNEVIQKADAELCTSSVRPMDPQVRMMAGIALYSAGDLDRSLHELRAASLLDDKLWLAAVYQGMCLESMGLPDLARAEYRHVVRVLESNPDYHSKLPKELEGLGPDLLEMARKKSA